jgi:RNA polymerase sigma-70 factor, ECF subfamily
MEVSEEQQLIEYAKTDGDAFGKLYDLHYAKIFNYILRRTGDVAIAEDITTEVFIKALERISGFTWQGLPFSAWLYRIASNEIANYFRSKNTKNLSLDAMMEEQGFEPVSDVDIEASLVEAQDEIERHQQFIAIQKRLLLLPVKYQEVLSLRYFEKKSIAEISQIMSKRPGTIKSLLSRGTKKLREEPK